MSSCIRSQDPWNVEGKSRRANAGLAGQAVLEGAFLIPVILLLLLLLVQPAILLYDRTVMNGAAAEGCRLLSTKSSSYGNEAAYENYVLRKLGAIPQQENFHVHQSGCSYEVVLEGDEATQTVKVCIENQVRPLPFFDWGARVLGVVNSEGNFVVKTECELPAKNEWVASSEHGLDPKSWVEEGDAK